LPGSQARHRWLVEPSFVGKLRRRNVVRVGILYLAVCWLILEPVHVVFHMLEVPLWANRLVILLMALGFPVALIFAWVYELTPGGLKTTLEIAHAQSIGRQTARRLDRAIIAVLAVGISYLLLDKFRLSQRAPTPQSAAAVVQPSVAPLPRVLEKSIAVLPFVDMSEKRDQGYFSDGLSEELIDLLTKVSDLHVAARTSSFYFKGKPATVADIAKELGVTHVLEGSVRKAGRAVRITVQLIRADNGYHLWSQTYDRQLNDIFKIQDDIAGAVVQALKVRLLVGNLPASGEPQHAEAYNLLLQSRFFGRRGAEGDEQRALEYIQRAIALDPDYALPWAWLSSSYDSRDPRSRSAAQRALELDSLLPDAHVSLGYVFEYYDWNWKAADAEFKRALALDPNDEHALRANGDLAMRVGRSQEAVKSFKRAADRDPLSPGAMDGLGDALRVAGSLPEAETAYRRALVLSPQDYWAHTYLGMVLFERGDLESALREVQQSTNESFRLWGLTLVYFAMGRKTDSDQALAELTAKYAQQWPSMVAVAHGFRNERDTAFDWFARAYNQHDPGVTWLKVGPLWRNVRRDPRYAEWLRKLNLQD
jgi:adenylate cyclase